MSAEGNSGLSRNLFMDVDQARRTFGLEQRDSLFASDLDRSLQEHGIATIEMPVSDSDFQRLIDGYEVCLGECPEVLKETRHIVDVRYGNEAGQVRKTRKFSKVTGKQIQ